MLADSDGKMTYGNHMLQHHSAYGVQSQESGKARDSHHLLSWEDTRDIEQDNGIIRLEKGERMRPECKNEGILISKVLPKIPGFAEV